MVFGLPGKLGAGGASVNKVLIHLDLTSVSLEECLVVLRQEKNYIR